MRRIILLVLLFLSSATGAAFAASPAPYGLQWGQTPEALRLSGITIVKAGSEGNFDIYVTDRLPYNLGEAEVYRLLFARDGSGLQQITMEGRAYPSDWQGAVGKAEYARVKLLIAQSYGAPQRVVESNLAATLERPTAFYSCLMMKSCGAFATIWRKSDSSGIVLMLQGLSSESGRLVITAEGPDFASASAK